MIKYKLEFLDDRDRRWVNHIHFEPFVSSGVELIAFYNASGRKETLTKEKARALWNSFLAQGWYRVG
jgi:hypothetical protein